MEVQLAGPPGHVQVRVEQHPQRVPEVGGVEVLLVGERAERLDDEPTQLRRIGHLTEQSIHAERIEVRKRSRALHLAADLHGTPRLGIRLRDARRLVDDPADAGREALPRAIPRDRLDDARG